ncbi:hypothetical protein C1645_824063 [Glomus cerebriforme]|uniref:DUF659 domain-containing protein n=1 Tax=Glomus cerebriforme TaxID=658196 RepID=A0A397SUU9_9GLOM|nr:hypothetical protein C1645_824063 [Glomus cerebriforme]
MSSDFSKKTNFIRQSIYDYCLITKECKEYFWCLKNYSDIFHHTGAFFDDEIIKIVNEIGPKKLAVIVSDNVPDIHLCRHEFVIETVQKVGIIQQYFAMSYVLCQFLKDAIKILKIKEEKLKAIQKLMSLLYGIALVLSEHENDIKIRIKDILYDRTFYENCRIIAFILYPFKVSIECLKSRTSTLANCYIYLLSLAGAIYHIPNQNAHFKNYCIIKFNKRFDEFSNDLLLLAFFLHSRYHEEICKLHTYYIINAKRKLPYYSTDTSENLLCEKMIETIMEIRESEQYMNR